jgi:hypothetical protein
MPGRRKPGLEWRRKSSNLRRFGYRFSRSRIAASRRQASSQPARSSSPLSAIDGCQPCCNVPRPYSHVKGRTPTNFAFLTTYSQFNSRSGALNFQQKRSQFKRQTDTWLLQSRMPDCVLAIPSRGPPCLREFRRIRSIVSRSSDSRLQVPFAVYWLSPPFGFGGNDHVTRFDWVA